MIRETIQDWTSYRDVFRLKKDISFKNGKMLKKDSLVCFLGELLGSFRICPLKGPMSVFRLDTMNSLEEVKS